MVLANFWNFWVFQLYYEAFAEPHQTLSKQIMDDHRLPGAKE
jgi:hypothetical protein